MALPVGEWLHEFTDLRDTVAQHNLGLDGYEQVTRTLMARISYSGRDQPEPKRAKKDDDTAPIGLASRPFQPLKDLGIGREEPHMQQPLVV